MINHKSMFQFLQINSKYPHCIAKTWNVLIQWSREMSTVIFYLFKSHSRKFSNAGHAFHPFFSLAIFSVIANYWCYFLKNPSNSFFSQGCTVSYGSHLKFNNITSSLSPISTFVLVYVPMLHGFKYECQMWECV